MDPRKIAEYKQVSAKEDTAVILSTSQVFQTFDTDGSGEISADELVQCLKVLGQTVSKQQAIAMINEVDVNHNNSIDFSEFLTMFAGKFSAEDLKKECADAFKNLFDQDGDGFLSAPELKHVMSSLGDDLTDAEIGEMLREADVDGDGKVSYSDFYNTMMRE
jgi:calmodulin